MAKRPPPAGSKLAMYIVFAPFILTFWVVYGCAWVLVMCIIKPLEWMLRDKKPKKEPTSWADDPTIHW